MIDFNGMSICPGLFYVQEIVYMFIFAFLCCFLGF